MTVEFDPITSSTVSPTNGGSVIISYSLEMDDGLNGEFTALTGLLQNSLKLKVPIRSPNVITGRTYRFRYRA